LAIALPATFIPLLIASFAAYAFTFMHFPGRNVMFLVIVSLLVVPNFVAMVPLLQLYGRLGIGGTFPSVWLFHIGFGMSLAIFLLRNYMATLPLSIVESASIDGASHYQTFYRLILPMSTPVLAAFAIFQFLWVWNDLLVALVFIGPGENAPLTVAVKNNLIGQQGQGWNLVTRRRHPDDDPADHRLPRHAAVLRPRPNGRLGEGVIPCAAGKPTPRKRWGRRRNGDPVGGCGPLDSSHWHSWRSSSRPVSAITQSALSAPCSSA
jgi:hypothetical protein